MLDKRLQGCLLLLLFVLTKASGSRAEGNASTTTHSEEALAPALSDSEEGKRRSLAAATFCVAIQSADPAALQVGLNWACGQGHANCAAIQPGGACYKQNNLPALASYAYNDYYQKNVNTGATCSFNGTATTTAVDPSSGQCIFAGSSTAAGGGGSASSPSGLSPPSSLTPGTGGFGNGSSSFGPSSALIPLDAAENLLSRARWALCSVLLLLPFVFL